MPVHRISRLELYEAVWTKPLSVLATEFGITGTGLKKVCARWSIPTPGRGYWARRAHGKSVSRPPLGEHEASRSDRISFKVSTDSIAPEVSKARQAALFRARDNEILPGAPGTQSFACRDGRLIDAPDHPVGLQMTKALARAKPNPQGLVSIRGPNLIPVTVGFKSASRAVSLSVMLVRAAETMGWTVRPSPNGLLLVVEGSSIRISLREKIIHRPQNSPPGDGAPVAHRMRGRLLPLPDAIDCALSGRLTFEILGDGGHLLKRRLTDTKNHSLECAVPELIAMIAAHAALALSNRRKAEDARRQREIWEAWQRRETAFQAREKRRSEFVAEIQAQLDEKARLIAVLSHLPTIDTDQPQTMQDLADWVRRKLKSIDALLSPMFLDLSIRSAGIGFAEKSDPAKEGHDEYAHHSRPVRLHFWSLDHEKGQASSVSHFQWDMENALARKLASQELVATT